MKYAYVLTLQVPTGRGTEVYESAGTLDLYAGNSRDAIREELKADMAEQLGFAPEAMRTLFWSLEPDTLGEVR